MFFIPLPIVLLEVLIFTTFVHFFDFWDVFFSYLAPSFIGAILFSLTGRSIVMALQGGFVQGQLPADRVLHKGALIIGSILLIVPLFLTRVLAIFLIVPVFRHLSVFIFKTFLFKRLKSSSFSFFQFGGAPGREQGSPRGAGGFGGFSRNPQEPRYERDVEVVNVTPIEITHTKIVESDSESGDSK